METILRVVLREKLAASGRASRIHSAAPEALLADTARQMSEANVGCILVMRDKRLVGLLSEREILHVFANGAADGAQATVASVMTRDPVTVAPSLSVGSALRICTHQRVRHLPVVDGGELLGLLSIGDLVSFVLKDKEDTISELMDYIHGP